jgi:hypothetical protein
MWLKAHRANQVYWYFKQTSWAEKIHHAREMISLRINSIDFVDTLEALYFQNHTIQCGYKLSILPRM